MKTKTLKLWMVIRHLRDAWRLPAVVAVFIGLLAGSASAQTTVLALGGGSPLPPYYGYNDGNTINAKFHTPCGLALDSTGQELLVADRDNSLIRVVDLVGGQTATLIVTYTNLIKRPIAVAADVFDDVYVLNTNGSIYTFDCNLYSPNYGDVITNALNLSNPTGMALDSADNIYVTVQGNKLIRIAAFGSTQTTIATIPMAGTLLQGIVVKHNGLVAACDAGRNGIYLINPATGQVTTNAGFHGVGDFVTNSTPTMSSSNTAKFNQPMCVAEAGDGTLIVSDFGNNRVKTVAPSGVVANLYGVTAQYWTASYPGWANGTVLSPDSKTPNVQARQPFGVVMAPDGSIYTSEDYYHLIRKVTGSGLIPPIQPVPPPGAPTIVNVTTNYGQVNLTWTTVTGATNYNVKRSNSTGKETTIATTSATSYSDNSVFNGSTYYYVVSAVNAGGEGSNSAEVVVKVPIPPPPAPSIGWFDYELSSNPNSLNQYVTVIHPFSILTFNNDQLFAINSNTNGVLTFYTTDGSTPALTNGYTPPPYQDGWTGAQPLPLADAPDTVIKAINIDAVGQSSPITTAEILYQVANPIISGFNGAQFTISDITTNVQFWYTTDGTTPTNGSPSIGPIVSTNGSPVTLGINVTTNVFFQVRAFRSGYRPSGTAVQYFSPANFVANTISFGFASGEASSTFVASPGQTFYAPVTLTTLPGAVIYSLQFNLVVTNAGLNPGPAVAPGAFDFQTMLMKPDPLNKGAYLPIPTYAFESYGFDYSLPPPVSNSIPYQGDWYQNLENTNVSENLLTVGWLERAGATNLFITTSQDLIKYSIAHDDLFPNALYPNNVILGGYAFQVPGNATNGQTYKIQIGRPSATSDGIGTPGSDVYIAAPTNGSTSGGAPINALKYVTVGQIKYLAGSVYPFSWFNAGDFGSSNIVNADVEQVFQSAIYGLNTPPPGSDFFDAMDSCGGTYVDLGHGYLEFNSYISGPAAINPLWDGNDTSINQIAFGDGVLDVCDVYVTFRRSLDPSLNWFQRYWNSGQRVAQIVPNVAAHPQATPVTKVQSNNNQPGLATAVSPQVNFTAADIQGTAGQTIQVPINATILGSYPLRVLMLNLSVAPLDGSPDLTAPVQFTQNAAVLGAPLTTYSDGNDNFSAVWLNSTNAGLMGSVTIGTLTFTIPSGAASNAAYAVHFDHASASPNGLASFPKQTFTGLVTLTSRTNSSFGDGIPDAWRLRWFGSIKNYLSASNACPSGDGVNNWKKFVAGVDPNTAHDFPSLNPKGSVPTGATTAIHWPSVSGVQYVVQRSSSLFPGNWTAIATNTGTGGDMEYDDTNTGKVKFYRVLILP
jgi:hypothetical protein